MTTQNELDVIVLANLLISPTRLQTYDPLSWFQLELKPRRAGISLFASLKQFVALKVKEFYPQKETRVVIAAPCIFEKNSHALDFTDRGI